MTICVRCRLELAPGARHPYADDCVEALRAELDRQRGLACVKCGNGLVCVRCSAKKITQQQMDKHAPGTRQALRILGEILRDD